MSETTDKMMANYMRNKTRTIEDEEFIVRITLVNPQRTDMKKKLDEIDARLKQIEAH